MTAFEYEGVAQTAQALVPDDLFPSRAGRGELRPDQLADRIVTMLALGCFLPGQRLPPERDFAATMGITRSVLRPALAELVEAGYLEIRRGRGGGAYVRYSWGEESTVRVRRSLLPLWDQLRDLLDLQRILEMAIARTAAARRTEADVDAIATFVIAYEEAGEDHAMAAAADRALHEAIAQCCANPHLGAIWDRLHLVITRGLRIQPYSDDLRRQALEQHRGLLEAIRDGDPDRAEQCAVAHFEHMADALRDLIARVAPEVELPAAEPAVSRRSA